MERPVKTQYHILGVEPSASQEEIHQAYLRRIKQVSNSKDPKRLTRDVERAYEVLSDSANRARYDENLAAKGVSAEGASSNHPPVPGGSGRPAGVEMERPVRTQYHILGVEPSASQEEIHQAYLRRIKQVSNSKDPKRLTRDVERAYEVLSDSANRARYDENLAAKGVSAEGASSGRRDASRQAEPRPQKEAPRPRVTTQQASSTRSPYEYRDGEDDAKAKDKRYWFDMQDNGVCNYCGHRYLYYELEMEHMIPREQGGPDHRLNMQLACKACNRLKGTSTDIEFRRLNAHLIPTEERTPPRRPVDPQALKPGTQGPR